MSIKLNTERRSPLPREPDPREDGGDSSSLSSWLAGRTGEVSEAVSSEDSGGAGRGLLGAVSRSAAVYRGCLRVYGAELHTVLWRCAQDDCLL